MKAKITLVISIVLLFATVKSEEKVSTLSYETSSVTDYNGNVYTTIKIGDLWWMAENLRATNYFDGAPIPAFTKTATVSADDYKDYYTYPNNEAGNASTYGLLYSWGVIANSTLTTYKQLLPSGWYVPTLADWQNLATALGGTALSAGNFDVVGGGYSVAGAKLKSTTLWTSPNTDATNEAGFNAVPAGDCNTAGYTSFGTEARFWTPNIVSAGNAGRKYVILSNTSGEITRNQYRNVNALSIRLVKSISTSVNQVDISAKPTLQSGFVNSSVIINNAQTNSPISIYSLNGALMRNTVTGSQRQFEWNVSDLPEGVYILSVKNTSGFTKLKFIKK